MKLNRLGAYLVIPLLAACAAYAYAISRPPRYEAAAELLIEHHTPKPDFGNNAALSNLQTEALRLRSPTTIGEALGRVDLGQTPTWRASADPVRAILDNLDVVPRPMDQRIAIRVRSSVRDEALATLAAIIASYQERRRRAVTDPLNDARQAIAEAKDDLLHRLHEQEEAYAEFRKRTADDRLDATELERSQASLAQITRERTNLILRVSLLDVQLDQIEDALTRGGRSAALLLLAERRLLAMTQKSIVAERRLRRDPATVEQLESLQLQERTLLQMLGPKHPRIKAVRARLAAFEQADSPLADLLAEECILLETYGPNYPKVLAVRKQIRELRSERPAPQVDDDQNAGRDIRADPLATYLAALREELHTYDVQFDELDILYDRERNFFKKAQQVKDEDQRRQRELQATRELFETVVFRAQGLPPGDAATADRVHVAVAPTENKIEAANATSLAMWSGLLGLLMVTGADFTARAIARRDLPLEEIARLLQVRLLGVIPRFPAEHSPTKRTQVGPPMPCLYEQKSAPAASYRNLRTALWFQASVERWKVIQVTSLAPGDGKSTFCANLGVPLAAMGKKVLLVDWTTRQPILGQLFELSSSQSTKDVSRVANLESPVEMVRSTEVANLWLVPARRAGRPLPPAAQLRESLAVWRERFDVVLIDAPSLAEDSAASLAEHVDAVLVLTRPRARFRRLKRAIRKLAIQKTPIAGLVVNQAEPTPRQLIDRSRLDAQLRHEGASD